jgi:hypothetical protein
MCAREETAGGVDRVLATNREFAGGEGSLGGPLGDQTKRFGGDQLADRERKVYLEYVGVGRLDAGGVAHDLVAPDVLRGVVPRAP